MQSSSDGVLYCFHDDDLQRITGDPRKFETVPSRDINRLRIDATHPIPKLAEIVDTFPDAYFNIDIKSWAAADPFIALTDAMNTLDISPEGNVLVSGGSDKLVKIWGYDEGLCYYDGRGHSGSVTKVKIAPDKSNIVSVGSEGAIFIWDYKDPPLFEENDI